MKVTLASVVFVALVIIIIIITIIIYVGFAFDGSVSQKKVLSLKDKCIIQSREI